MTSQQILEWIWRGVTILVLPALLYVVNVLLKLRDDSRDMQLTLYGPNRNNGMRGDLKDACDAVDVIKLQVSELAQQQDNIKVEQRIVRERYHGELVGLTQRTLTLAELIMDEHKDDKRHR